MNLRKNASKWLAALMLALTITSCDKSNDEPKWIVEFAPVVFELKAVNDQGENMLDPTNSLYHDYIKAVAVEYKGKKETINNFNVVLKYILENNLSRTYIPVYSGVYMMPDQDNNFHLYFGEFDGAVDYNGLSFMVYWPDGEADYVEYSRTITPDKPLPKITQYMRINGELIEGAVITHHAN